MVKVVPDANIWVSTLIKPHGNYAQLLGVIVERGELFCAEEILDEVKDVVLRPRIARKYALDEATVDAALAQIRTYTTMMANLPILDVVPNDPDDNKIVACAVKAQANFILSYDQHLIELGSYQDIQIVTPADFQRLV